MSWAPEASTNTLLPPCRKSWQRWALAPCTVEARPSSGRRDHPWRGAEFRVCGQWNSLYLPKAPAFCPGHPACTQYPGCPAVRACTRLHVPYGWKKSVSTFPGSLARLHGGLKEKELEVPESGTAGFFSRLCPWLVEEPLTSPVTSWGLGFHVCKVKIIILAPPCLNPISLGMTSRLLDQEFVACP